MKAFKVMFLAYVLTFIILFFYWKSSLEILFASSLRGFIMSLEVFLIILSVLFLYYLMKNTGKLEILKNFLENISSDKQIQIILIAWFLVSFFEGIAGFGTPAAIAAPLLVLLGVRAFSAVVLSLIADSVAVSFGAFGTPIIVGIEASVESANIAQISLYASILSGFISVFMPLVLLIVYNLLEYKNLKNLKKYIPLSLIAGLSFAIIYISSAFYLGPELPSVLASLIGFFIIMFCVKNGFFIKKEIKKNNLIKKSNLFFSFSPYLFLILLFIITRLNFFALGDFLKMLSFKFNFLNSGIEYSINLFHPWFLIFFSFIVFFLIFRLSLNEFKNIVLISFNKSKLVLLTLIFTLAFVQLIIYSNLNTSNLSGIPQIIASQFSNLGFLYLFVSPFIGAFGSYIAGSATVSNLIFSSLQESVAINNSLSSSLVLALQLAGASAGNMIAIHNIIAVLALVSLNGMESKIMKINLLIVFIYCFILGLLAYLIYLFF